MLFSWAGSHIQGVVRLDYAVQNLIIGKIDELESIPKLGPSRPCLIYVVVREPRPQDQYSNFDFNRVSFQNFVSGL